MPQEVEKAEQRSFLPDQATAAQPSAGPVDTPPALLDSGPAAAEGGAAEAVGSRGAQLSLPLEMDAEPEAEPRPPAGKEKRRRSRSGGFVPVTRDPDVARSYSDNVALDHAIARGLAQALSSLPPEELAALRAKVARARRGGRPPSSRS